MTKTIGNYEVSLNTQMKPVVTAEVLSADSKIDVNFKLWNDERYYVTRGKEQIGYITVDLEKAVGKTSTNTKYLNWMIAAIKQF